MQVVKKRLVIKEKERREKEEGRKEKFFPRGMVNSQACRFEALLSAL